MKLSKEVKIGLTVLVSIAFFLYGFNFLKGKNIFTQRTKFYAIYDNVGGLTESNPVMIRGFAVGQVNKIFFHPNNSKKLVVELSLQENDLLIPKNTVAKVYSSGLLGGMAVELVFGDAKEFIQNGDTLSSELDAGIMAEIAKHAEPVKNKAENLLVSADSLLNDLNKFVSPNSNNNLNSILLNLSKITIQLNSILLEQREKINNLTTTLNNNTGKIDNTMKNISSITDSIANIKFAETVNELESTMKKLNQTLDKIDKGEGTLGLLINDKKLYGNLESSTKNLDKLLIDLKEHPKRYVQFSVFSKKEKVEEKK